jgi:hypothetical protein
MISKDSSDTAISGFTVPPFFSLVHYWCVYLASLLYVVQKEKSFFTLNVV